MSTLAQADRNVLHDVADVLIPATRTMPALRDADPAGTWLDRACLARADLVPSLARALRVLAGTADLPAAVRRLHGDDHATFDVVATFVAGTYYMIPQVRELIGYPGQRRMPAAIDAAADELSDDVFQGALDYARTYRPA
jgi:hypothetical protein